MPSARRPINNLGDVQLALNDIFTQLDNITTKPQNFNKRIVTGIPDPANDLDAVNYETLKSYVATQIEVVKKAMPPKQTTLPPDAASESFSKNLVPKLDNKYSIGSTALAWLKGWFYNLNLKGLTATRPLKLDGSNNVISGKIDLSAPSTDIQNTLGIANGGTGGTTASAARTTLNAANATTYTGSITGTANLTTGAVTGTCSITITP